MKTVVLLLSLSFSMLLCNGQSIVQKEKSGNSSMSPNQDYQYVSILNSGGIWSEIYISPEPVYPDTKIVPPSYERFTISGEDTIINGIIYKKLYMFYDSVFIKSKATVIGGIREDENKKVYYKGKTIHPLKPSTSTIKNNGGQDGDEVLLYDFDIKIGDTLKIDNLTFPDEIITVASIDTVLIGNAYRKEFSFKYGNIQEMRLIWIEGIGSTKGLLFTSGDTPTNGLHNDLICFKQDNQTLYFNNSYSSCFPDLISNAHYLSVFGKDTTQWNVTDLIPDLYQTTIFKAYGDTIINGMSYKPVFMGYWYYFGKKHGYLREDTETGKLWFLSLENKEQLIMDLSLQKADTFIFDPKFAYTVDSVYYQNEKKYLLLKGMYYGSVLFTEGIGPSNFLYLSMVQDPNRAKLRCMFKDNLLVYHNNEFNNCIDTITGIENIRARSFNIHPNPANNYITIDLNEKNTFRIELYNKAGLKVHDQMVKDDTPIYIGSFPSGMYIVRISTKSAFFISKFIKL